MVMEDLKDAAACAGFLVPTTSAQAEVFLKAMLGILGSWGAVCSHFPASSSIPIGWGSRRVRPRASDRRLL